MAPTAAKAGVGRSERKAGRAAREEEEVEEVEEEEKRCRRCRRRRREEEMSATSTSIFLGNVVVSGTALRLVARAEVLENDVALIVMKY